MSKSVIVLNMVKYAKFVVFAYRPCVFVKGFFEDWYVVESWIFFFKKKVQNKPNFHKLRKIKNFQLLCLFKGRTTLNHYAFCVIVIVPVGKRIWRLLGSCSKFYLFTSAKL